MACQCRPCWTLLIFGVLAGSPASPWLSAQESGKTVQIDVLLGSGPTDALLKDLKAENVDVRRAAANRVLLADRATQEKALPLLIEILEGDKDGQVRLAVLDSLASLGPAAEPAIPALVKTLKTDFGGRGSEATHQDYRSALALSAIGEPAVEGLRGLLGEKKESVRAEVIMSLGRIGPPAKAAIPELIPLLTDQSERIRREASIALAGIGEAAIGPLVEAAEGADTLARRMALEGLGRIKPPNDAVRTAVLGRAEDSEPDVRAAAVRALAALKVPEDVLAPLAIKNLKDPVESVRLAVVNLLVQRPALLSRLAPDLEPLLTAEDEGVAHHAAFLLGKAGPAAMPRLLEALRRKESRIDPIAEALAQSGSSAVGSLIEAAGDSDPRVRQAAALALGRIRPLSPNVLPRLTAGLSDESLEAKTAFLTAIGLLGPRGKPAVPAVRSLLRHPSSEIRLRSIQILAISSARDEAMLADLLSLIDDSETKVQIQVIDQLRLLGPPGRKALPNVIKKLESPSPEIRLAAAEMIGSHGRFAGEAVPGLSNLLSDPSPRIRTIAAQTLGKLGKDSQPALAKLVPLLDMKEMEVREAAVSTIGSLELDVDTLRPHLAKALRDEKLEVRRAAIRSIQKLGPPGAIFIPDLILLTEKKENLTSVQRILRRFEMAGPDVRSLPDLVKCLDHDQENVRLLAIKFIRLAGHNARDVIPSLDRMREDPSAEVRKQAEAAAEQIRGGSVTSAEKSTKGT